MNRRAFLASLTALSGCIGASESDSLTETEQSTGSTDIPHSTRLGMLETKVSSAAGAEYLRYYDASRDELAQLQPEREWWVMVMVSFKNLGDESVTTPTPDQFSLVSGSELYRSLTAVPRVSWDQVRPRSDWFKKPGLDQYSDDVKPDSSEHLYLLYDVARFEDPVIHINADTTHRLSPRFVTRVSE